MSNAISVDTRLRQKLLNSLGPERFSLLVHGLAAFERILPHVTVEKWKEAKLPKSGVVWQGQERRALYLRLQIPDDSAGIQAVLGRRIAPKGVGKVRRAIAVREHAVCKHIIELLTSDLAAQPGGASQVFDELRRQFDERVVARYLRSWHNLGFDPRSLLDALRQLAEQKYETKALTFGTIVDLSSGISRAAGSRFDFPEDYLTMKKYRVLTDGYRTAYLLSASGEVTGLLALDSVRRRPKMSLYFPEWARDFALTCQQHGLGFVLTRHGDIIVFERGNLRLSYRAGKWQYWNHNHIIDLVQNRARVQRVAPNTLSRLAAKLYRLALDVSFRHTGGLLLILRRREDIHEVVRQGDAMADKGRQAIDKRFDLQLPSKGVLAVPQAILGDLAALDGAIVVANNGKLLAYGAVLEPKKTRGVRGSEGARTKAAIGASHFGLAIKISADGDIAFYQNGKQFLAV